MKRQLQEKVAKPVRIGSLAAHIPGDYRYSDYMSVVYLPEDKVEVTVSESGAVGGMDSQYGSTSRQSIKKVVPADPKSVAAAVKSIISNDKLLFKRYGKPTKNFRWMDTDFTLSNKGLSMANITTALNTIRGENEDNIQEGTHMKITIKQLKQIIKEEVEAASSSKCEACGCAISLKGAAGQSHMCDDCSVMFDNPSVSGGPPCDHCGSDNTEMGESIPSMMGYGEDTSWKCLDCGEFSADTPLGRPSRPHR